MQYIYKTYVRSSVLSYTEENKSSFKSLNDIKLRKI